MMANRTVQILKNMKMLMIKSGKSSRGQSLGSFGDEGGDKLKASICRSNGGKTGSDGKW